MSYGHPPGHRICDERNWCGTNSQPQCVMASSPTLETIIMYLHATKAPISWPQKKTLNTVGDLSQDDAAAAAYNDSSHLQPVRGSRICKAHLCQISHYLRRHKNTTDGLICRSLPCTFEPPLPLRPMRRGHGQPSYFYSHPDAPAATTHASTLGIQDPGS
jgi:hypothetical protein